MKKILLFPLLALIATFFPSCQAGNPNNNPGDSIVDTLSVSMTDTAYFDYTVGKEHAREPIVIDIDNTLTPPKNLLSTMTYDHLIKNYFLEGKVPVSHNRCDRELVRGDDNPFFNAMYRAYADHRPFELSPEALWLLICQGFSYHVNNNAEKLRSMFVNFEGKKTLTVHTGHFPNEPEQWEQIFPQFTKQIASYTGQKIVSALGSNFTTSTPVSHTASQITVMVAMQKYFDYEIYITCGIPRVILHGSPEDWQSIIDRLQVLREYKLAWWVDKMLPVLEKIKRASEGEVDKEFWRNMFKYHKGERYGCEPPHSYVNGWIVKFYPYSKKGTPNFIDELEDGSQHLPSEVLTVPVKVTGEVETNLTLSAGFVGVAQDSNTFALRPEIGWFITEGSVPDKKK